MTEMSEEFREWFNREYPADENGARPKYRDTGVLELMQAAYQAKQAAAEADSKRAFEIADEAMLELLYGHCIPSADSIRLDLIGELQQEVTRIEDADRAIRDALDWLQPRGLVELMKDESGEYILVECAAIEQKEGR